MNKKAIFGVIFTLSLAFGGLNSSHVSAVEIQPRGEVVTQPIELSDDSDSAAAETILEEGTADEPLVVCADESEPGCEDTNPDPEIVEEDGNTVEVEPEMWPLIISLAALGGTVVFVIIINLFGRKNK